MALVMTFSQCKKDDKIMPTAEGEKVLVTLKIGSNSNSKVVVTPETGGVTFENGDVIHVASNGVYVGTLAYDSNLSRFSGNITEPTEGQKLHFYFLGKMTPEFSTDNSQCSVIISDQTTKLPVISYNTSRENYQVGKTDYNTTLLNKCALVKFNVTTPSNSPICITGMKNKVTVDFLQNTVTPSMNGEGVIKLPAGSGEIFEKWAILLPQVALEEGENGSAYSEDGAYLGTRGAVPTIGENGYYDTGIEVNVTSIAVIDHEYVDLGLPSGLLWATCNVGANAPEEYGDYFAWGETQPKDVYNWSTYQYCNGSSNTLTKYCFSSEYGYNGYTDILTYLQYDDDAARANWGNDWRTPTKSEWMELCQNTTISITTINNVKGWLFTASNGNSLFLPAAGFCIGSNHSSAGNYGYYWSVSLNLDYSYTAWLYSSANNNMGSYNRSNGSSIRPVRFAQRN